MSLKKLLACLKEKNNFLITAHTNLEGDAIGAEMAFSWLLEKMNKHTLVVNDDIIPSGYDFLPKIKKARRFKKNGSGLKFDCLVALDCSDLKRCGELSKINLDGKIIINIDHHISNERFGDINWVEPESSSTAEMVYKLYKKLDIPFDQNTALALYIGMLTDTGSFRYSNTTSLTHQAVAELLKYGLDVKEIYHQIYENIPYPDMQLLAGILPGMKRFACGKVIWFELSLPLWKGKRISFDLSEHILSFGRAVKGAEVVCLFKENLGKKSEIRVNFRSQGKVDVNKIARFFGGGGHKTASGATISGSREVVRRKVLSELKEAVDKL